MWCFYVQMFFIKERIKPNFVRDIYQTIIDTGFAFDGGSAVEGKFDDEGKRIRRNITSLEEIYEYNQTRFEQRLRDGFPDDAWDVDTEYDHELGYRHIYFKRDGFSSGLHGYWHDHNGHPAFSICIEEFDVEFKKAVPGKTYKETMYIKEKIEPLKNMALALWEKGKVDVIQTTHDMDDPWYDIYDVARSENIYYNPFALMFEKFYEKYPAGYFDRDFAKAKVTKIAHKGVYIEQTDRIVAK